jgi:hypothetical protein
MRPANPYKYRPEPHFKQISNGKKRKSKGKTPHSGEFQRVPRAAESAPWRPSLRKTKYVTKPTVAATNTSTARFETMNDTFLLRKTLFA